MGFLRLRRRLYDQKPTRESGKPSLPQLTHEPIIAQTLPNIIYLVCHARPLLLNFFQLG